MSKLAVVAVGGNSLIKDSKRVTIEDQQAALRETAHHIADMVEAGWDLAIGHGNGPQVGFILRRSEIAAKVEGMHEVPLDVCGADSQGAIGYEFQQALQNEYHKRGIRKGASTIITQVMVDKDDPAFQNPTKPIGSFLGRRSSITLSTRSGYPGAEHDRRCCHGRSRLRRRRIRSRDVRRRTRVSADSAARTGT
jgi:carbamate kinase